MTDKTLNLRHTKKLPITDDIRAVYDAAYAKKHRAAKYREVAKGISPWLNRLVTAYKERGMFPITPAILGDFYKDKNDRIIATLVGSLCITNGSPDTIMKECETMRREMGKHPYKDFFAGRQYVLMSLGDVQEDKLGGVRSMKYWHVGRLVDSLWNSWDSYDGMSVEEVFKHTMKWGGLTPYDALSSMLNMDYVRVPDYRINLALEALCGVDGISYHLWDIGGSVAFLRPPMEKWAGGYVNMDRFLNILIPGCTKYGFTAYDVADMVGLKKPVDIWYAYHAYKQIYSRRDVVAYMRRYHSQCKNLSVGTNNRSQLRIIEPRIF